MIAFCSVPAESPKAELLRQASLIIWDEAVMSHRHNFQQGWTGCCVKT
jgi:hypothetical protein